MQTTFEFADLDRDLPAIPPAERVCVLSVFLAENLENLTRHCAHLSSPAEWTVIATGRMTECLNRLASIFGGSANLALREVHAGQERLVRYGDKSWANYCDAVEQIGRDYYSAIFEAADRDAYGNWLIGDHSPQHYPDLPAALIGENWPAIVAAIQELPTTDFGDLLLRIENELIEVRKSINEGDFHPAIPVITSSAKAATIEYAGTKYSITLNWADAFREMIEAGGLPVGIGEFVRKPNESIEALREQYPELAAIIQRGDGNKGYRVTVFDLPNSSAGRRADFA